jgi:hypothetical protein
MPSPTGNKTHDATVLAAEAVRQGVVNVAGVSQSTANTATIVYYQCSRAKSRTASIAAVKSPR